MPSPTTCWKTLTATSDEHLAGLFLAGQHDALAVLYDRYSVLVFSIAVRIVKDEAEAEEVVQTVFLDISRALANFDERKGTLKVWLLQYAYHRALHRKRHLQANRFYSWVELDEVCSQGHIPPTLEAMERVQLLNHLLEGTTARRRAVLEMTYCDGMTASEIALQINISPHMVRHELYRGLAELRKLMAKDQLAKAAVSSSITKARISNA